MLKTLNVYTWSTKVRRRFSSVSWPKILLHRLWVIRPYCWALPNLFIPTHLKLTSGWKWHRRVLTSQPYIPVIRWAQSYRQKLRVSIEGKAENMMPDSVWWLGAFSKDKNTSLTSNLIPADPHRSWGQSDYMLLHATAQLGFVVVHRRGHEDRTGTWCWTYKWQECSSQEELL